MCFAISHLLIHKQCNVLTKFYKRIETLIYCMRISLFSFLCTLPAISLNQKQFSSIISSLLSFALMFGSCIYWFTEMPIQKRPLKTAIHETFYVYVIGVILLSRIHLSQDTWEASHELCIWSTISKKNPCSRHGSIGTIIARFIKYASCIG